MLYATYSVVIQASVNAHTYAGMKNIIVAELTIQLCDTDHYAALTKRQTDSMLDSVLDDECASGSIAEFIKMVKSGVAGSNATFRTITRFNLACYEL